MEKDIGKHERIVQGMGLPIPKKEHLKEDLREKKPSQGRKGGDDQLKDTEKKE